MTLRRSRVDVVTLPSHANILSGRLPLDHGVRDNSGFRFPQAAETLATLLKKEGYATGAFVSAFPLESRFGLTRGFDVYDDRFGGTGESVAFHMEERRGSETVAAARRWLDTQVGKKTFTWIHVYDPHAPYTPLEPYASRFAGEPYIGEVAAADAALGPILEPLLVAGPDARTLVVLTADHGEALGEHGEATHGIFVYEGTLRVPLILWAPGRLPARLVASSVQHVDIGPDRTGPARRAGSPVLCGPQPRRHHRRTRGPAPLDVLRCARSFNVRERPIAGSCVAARTPRYGRNCARWATSAPRRRRRGHRSPRLTTPRTSSSSTIWSTT